MTPNFIISKIIASYRDNFSLKETIDECTPLLIGYKFGNEALKKLNHIPLESVMKVVSLTTRIDEKLLVCSRKYTPYVHARYLYYYFCKEHTGASLVDIGKSVNRDHSTIIHGIKKHSDIMMWSEDTLHAKEYQNNFKSIESEINEIIKQNKLNKE